MTHAMNWFTYLPKRDSLLWLLAGLVSIAGVGAIDFWTGKELSFSLFYLLPILVVTWFAGRNAGIFTALIGAATWFVADTLAGLTFSQPMIAYWNVVTRLGFFLAIALLLPALKELEEAKLSARTDFLTGVANRRSFFEIVQNEIDRFQRHRQPFAIVYIDLDGFKGVNDQFGHRAGDELLRVVARQIKTCLRKTDTIARMGGDEFILLLTEIDKNAPQAIISRIQHALLEEMQRRGWPVTFSIGVLICYDGQPNSEELVKRADDVMYSVKKNGKNAVAYAIYAGEGLRAAASPSSAGRTNTGRQRAAGPVRRGRLPARSAPGRHQTAQAKRRNLPSRP